MHTIKHVSARILEEKLQDAGVVMPDIEATQDIISLLVRARKMNLEKDEAVYVMSDEAIMGQVVRFILTPLPAEFSCPHSADLPSSWS